MLDCILAINLLMASKKGGNMLTGAGDKQDER